jgi:hypothetical protein
VIHNLLCFGGGLLLCLFSESSVVGVYFFAPPPFSGTGFSVPPPPPLSVLHYSSLFVFQFCGTVQFWVLLSGSGYQLCDPLPALD